MTGEENNSIIKYTISICVSEQDTFGEPSGGVQVELFRSSTERKPGDTNVRKWGFDVHPKAFPIACLVIAFFIAFTVLFRSQAVTMFDTVQAAISAMDGWFYILSVNVFIVVTLSFAFSKYGQIRIGGVEAEKEFSNFSWMAMLFSAGMWIGPMFFSVAEPIFHFRTVSPFFEGVESATVAASGTAMAMTYSHWGIHPWAIHTVYLGLRNEWKILESAEFTEWLEHRGRGGTNGFGERRRCRPRYRRERGLDTR